MCEKPTTPITKNPSRIAIAACSTAVFRVAVKPGRRGKWMDGLTCKLDPETTSPCRCGKARAALDPFSLSTNLLEGTTSPNAIPRGTPPGRGHTMTAGSPGSRVGALARPSRLPSGLARRALAAHSCGGSHGTGSLWVDPFRVPFHPPGFVARRGNRHRYYKNAAETASSVVTGARLAHAQFGASVQNVIPTSPPRTTASEFSLVPPGRKMNCASGRT